jgi:ribosomal protein S27E
MKDTIIECEHCKHKNYFTAIDLRITCKSCGRYIYRRQEELPDQEILKV